MAWRRSKSTPRIRAGVRWKPDLRSRKPSKKLKMHPWFRGDRAQRLKKNPIWRATSKYSGPNSLRAYTKRKMDRIRRLNPMKTISAKSRVSRLIAGSKPPRKFVMPTTKPVFRPNTAPVFSPNTAPGGQVLTDSLSKLKFQNKVKRKKARRGGRGGISGDWELD